MNLSIEFPVINEKSSYTPQKLQYQAKENHNYITNFIGSMNTSILDKNIFCLYPEKHLFNYVIQFKFSFLKKNIGE